MKEPKIVECPKCGCKSFITTRKGTMCTNCKKILEESFLKIDGPKTIQ